MISPEFVIFEDEHWIVNHRIDSAYAGYLMVASKSKATELTDLCSDALQGLGLVLAKVQMLLNATFLPYKVVFSKLGFSKGFNCHFHAVPVSESVIEEVRQHYNYTDEEPDGLDVMLFINREYCENQDPKVVQSVVSRSVAKIREYS